MILYDRLDQALQRLPRTAGGVAAYLVDRGITGIQEDCWACPLARWLRQTLQVPLARVETSYVYVIDDQNNFAGLVPPAGVDAFIGEFDLGNAYPDLVDENGPTDEERWNLDHADDDL